MRWTDKANPFNRGNRILWAGIFMGMWIWEMLGKFLHQEELNWPLLVLTFLALSAVGLGGRWAQEVNLPRSRERRA